MTDDLISREEAYIVLSEYYHHRTYAQHQALREALSKVPTVDAVKVVRCKDCELGVFETYGEYGHYCCHDQFIETGEEYCAWAERKETEHD